MTTYIRLLLSGALMNVGLFALMLIHGGWEPVDLLFTLVVAATFLASFISLLVAAERTPPQGPRA